MEDKRLQQLAERPVGRLLWQYSLPAVTGMLVQALYNLVDRVFLGQVCGADTLTALTVTFPMMNLATAIGVLVGVGSASRVSIALGAGMRERADGILGNALTLTVLNGLLYVLVFGLFMEPMLGAFGADARILPLAKQYMYILLPGLILTNVAFSLNNVMRASGYPGRAMTTMIIGAVVNCILDPLFIIVFDMGIAGAAIATDIAMGVSAVYVLRHFSRRDSTVRFRRGTYALRWRTVWSIFTIGCAPALVNAAASLINLKVNTSLIDVCGADANRAIAAAGIFGTYTTIGVTITLGLCMGMQPIIGYNYGAGHMHRLRRTFLLATAAATVLTATTSLVGEVWPQWVARVFTTDTALIDTTVTALRYSLWAFAVVGFQIISTALFQSIGKVSQSIFLSLTRQVIFLIPLLFLLPPQMGAEGVWTSFPVSDVLATIVTVILVQRQLRQFTNANTAPVPQARQSLCR